jgi:hypothetical protein
MSPPPEPTDSIEDNGNTGKRADACCGKVRLSALSFSKDTVAVASVIKGPRALEFSWTRSITIVNIVHGMCQGL